MIRAIVTLATAVALLVFAAAAHAAKYKCQDAAGNWTEEACPKAPKDTRSPSSAARPASASSEAPFDSHRSPAVGMTETDVYNLDPPWNRPESTHSRRDHGAYVDEFWYKVDGVVATRLIFRNGSLTEISHTPPETIPEPPFDPHGGPVIGMRLSNVYNLDPPWNRPSSTLERHDSAEGVRYDEYSYAANGARLIFKNGVLFQIK